MDFPLETWETFHVVVPARFNAVGRDIIKGLIYGKPGDTTATIVARARAHGHCGLFKDHQVVLERIDG